MTAGDVGGVATDPAPDPAPQIALAPPLVTTTAAPTSVDEERGRGPSLPPALAPPPVKPTEGQRPASAEMLGGPSPQAQSITLAVLVIVAIALLWDTLLAVNTTILSLLVTVTTMIACQVNITRQLISTIPVSSTDILL